MRFKAARSLGMLQDQRALPGLIKALEDEEPTVHLDVLPCVARVSGVRAGQHRSRQFLRREGNEPVSGRIGGPSGQRATNHAVLWWQHNRQTRLRSAGPDHS
ncbi:MAG: hypothetical protein VX664_10150 [Chloroflexota bacterium]|nr:hypothetical protein [Chloroflexota bacterium]